jgi:hypothetical protein
VYGTLADVYDFLVPEALLSPEGSAAAFDELLAGLPAGARVLDCACGTGTLAVGLALRGFDVTASDASAAMVERARALSAERGVALEVATRAGSRSSWRSRTARSTPSGSPTGPSRTASSTRTCAPPASSRRRARGPRRLTAMR